MLRKTDGERTAQNEMMSMMGVGSRKIASDEVEVLTSYSLMEQVVKRLQLNTACYYRDLGKWMCQYRNPDFSLRWSEKLLDDVIVDIYPKGESACTVKVSVLNNAVTLRGVGYDTEVETFAGKFSVQKNNPAAEYKHYRVIHESVLWTVYRLQGEILVSRLSRESEILRLSSLSTVPERTVDVINTLLLFYNEQAVFDKNLVAKQAERFLAERLMVMSAELDSAEVELENYKREYRISDINQTAGAYRSYSDQYQRKVAEMDAEADVLDFVRGQISQPENEYSVIPGNLGLSDATLQRIVQEYNTLVLKRDKLLQTALPDNPAVVQISDQIQQTRRNLISAIDKARLSLERMRDHEHSQQEHYDARLGALPQQERRYQEMLRARAAKEKAYLYLVEKKEENALLLASGAVPAKIVDPALINPVRATPRLRIVLGAVLLVGMVLPLLFFLAGAFLREFKK